MTPATLLPPANPQSPPAPSAERGPPIPRFPQRTPLSQPPQHDPTGRPTRVALAVSVVLHLLLALAFVLAPERSEPDTALVPDDRLVERVDYVDIGGWPDPGAQAAAAPAGAGAPDGISAAAADSAFRRTLVPSRFPDRAPAALPVVPRPGPAAGAPRAGAPAGPGGAGNAIGNNPAGGRMGPGFGDRRLIVRPEAVPERDMSDMERYYRHLNSRLGQYNDSIADQAERERRARNWVWRDSQGREWGIAEGGTVIVGGRRIPVPVAPPITRDRDQMEREREQTRQRAEIDEQVERGEIDANFRERTRAIRERRDAERRRERERAGRDSTSSNP